jgi:glycosyltransferase involved in cell wall biosynthesis
VVQRSAPERLLVLTKGLGRGGAERIVVTTARHTQAHGLPTEVAYVLPHKDALAPELVTEGVPVHDLGGGRLRWVLALRRLLRSGGFDVVHTHMPVVAAAARLLAPRGTVLVHTEHNLWERYHPLTRWANALTYRRNRAVLAVSAAVAASVPRRWLGDASLSVLEHGIDEPSAPHGPQAREAARRVLGLAAGTPVIGTVANLTPKKDQATLLRAFAAVRRELPSAALVVVGTGPLAGALEEDARGLGVSDGVRWLGSRADVPQLLPGFDVFCLSSRHEGLPISLLEAMAAQVAPVCTAVGGVGEVLTDQQDGLLVPPEDPATLASALVRVLRDPALRTDLAAAAKSRSRDFSAESAARRIEDVYAAAAGGS